MIEKQSPYRNPKWLEAVRSLDFCVRCGQYGVQAAHRNEGKGIGMKVSDCLCAALCPDCHALIDQGRALTKEQLRAEMDAAIVATLEKLVKAGKVKLL